jgi:arylsulfatase A-like enzyme
MVLGRLRESRHDRWAGWRHDLERSSGAPMRASIIPMLLLAATCSGSGSSPVTSTIDGGAATADASLPIADAGAVNPANVVFILTDDLSWNLVQYMPHVLDMQKRGTTFSHYYVTDSLCCPSRSSIFTGKFPHNTTVFTNSGANGGYQQFEKAGNATATFATLLGGAGYHVGMMGKYLNGYTPKVNMQDPGWTEWDVSGEGGYNEFGYDLNQNGTVKTYGNAPTAYMVDVLSGLGTTFVSSSASGRFLLEIATFAPHAPYTPAPRYVGKFNVMLPRTPPFDTRNTNPPTWLAEHPDLTTTDMQTLDTGFNLRVEAVQAVDDLIAALETAVTDAGVGANTYFVFSSDNGYHMGEHMLLAGKQTAFETDINVPLIVVGPGVPPGVTVDSIVENIDLCPTFAELAGAAAPAGADGHSLVALLHGQTVSDWRNVALIEHHGPDLETMDPSDPDNEDKSVQPNSYEAIRMTDSVYVEYQDGEKEYYDLATDPNELTNTASSLSTAQVQQFHGTITAIQTCQGASSCWAAQHM